MNKAILGILLIIMLAVSAATLAALVQKIGASAGKPAASSASEPAGRARLKNVEFAIQTPASNAEITGDFTNWKRTQMKRHDESNWYAVFELQPGSYRYNFIVDGRTYLDPNSPEKGRNPEGGICSIKLVR